MALNGLNCAAVPLRIYSLTHTQRLSPVAADCSTPALQQQHNDDDDDNDDQRSHYIAAAITCRLAAK